MRPGSPVLLVTAFGAGLATGLAHFWPGAIGIAVAVVAALLAGRAGLFAGALVLGALHGHLAARFQDRTCAARLPPGALAVEIRLAGAATQGVVMGHPEGVACRGPIPLLWPGRQHRPAGSTVKVEGRWVPRRALGGRTTGLLVVRTVGTARGDPGLAARLDGWIVGTSATLFGSRAVMVDALVLGRRGAIPRDLREGFARSGLVHLLSISGFHVGLLAGWMLLLLRALRLPRGAAAFGAAAMAAVYVGFLGWPAPATRAAALAWVAALAFVRQRRVQPTPLLALTALAVLLVDPWAVFDLGGWLSVSALWGATRFSRWSDEALGPHPALRTLFTSVGAVLATAPFTAAAFGSVALVGIVLNFAAIPLAAVAVPGIFAALLVAAISPALAAPLAAGSGLALAGLERLALLGAAVPGGAAAMAPGWESGLAWGVGLLVACWIVAPRIRAGHAAARLALLATLVVWGHLLTPWRLQTGADDGRLSLFFLDVGQGDAAAIRTPRGRWVLVDGGPAGVRHDAGREVVAPFLVRQGVRRLEAVVVSHGHADHLGGVDGVLDRVGATVVLEPASLVPDSLYLAFLSRLELERVPWHPGRAGDRWEMDGVTFRVIHPDTSWAGWGEDLNEDSLVLLVEFGAFRAVLAGDAGLPAERRLRGRVGRVDVLKAGHHGSRTATGQAWLSELSPAAVVMSVGRNTYGHPDPGVVARVVAAGAALWRTDRQGTVTVRTDGRTVRITGRRGTQEFEAGSGKRGQSP